MDDANQPRPERAISAPRCARLAARAVVSVAGKEARNFLQGLITNDVRRISPTRAIYAALLTPQGKFLHDFFIAESDGTLLLDCEAARRDDLVRRLLFYRLRAEVAIAAADELIVAVGFGSGTAERLGLAPEAGAARPLAGGALFVDPRLAEAGVRAIAPAATAEALFAEAGFATSDDEAYDRHRLALGLPDGSRDIAVERGFLLESNLDALGAVAFDKGCYVGQELTARTRYRARIRKRLVPVRVQGPLPPPGTPVRLGEREVGELRSGRDGRALALLRLDALAGAPLRAGDVEILPEIPEWLRLTIPSPVE